MAPKKKVSALIKLQIEVEGQPGPAAGPGSGFAWREHHGLLQGIQCPDAGQDGSGHPVEITVYEDRSFTFVLKTPPAAALLKKAAGVEKGTENPLTHKVGSVTKAQVREIAEIKMEDLSARDIEAGMKIIRGHCSLDGHHGYGLIRRRTDGKAFQEVPRSC